MNWYYAAGGQQQGPIDDAQFDALINVGTITPDTLVWRDGMANWQPLREVRPSAPAPSAIPPVVGTVPVAGSEPGAARGIVCCECGKSFPLDQVIKYENRYVCATCKPVFLQRLTEGASLASAGAASLSEHEVLEGEYRIEIGECLERAWKVFTENAGLIIGASLVAFVVLAGCWVIATLAGLAVPGANTFLSFFFTGPLAGGYAWFFLKLARREEATVADAFFGFTHRFVPLMLTSLVQGLINMACMLPLIGLGVGFGIFGVMRRGGPPPSFTAGLSIGMVLAMIAGIIALIYINTLWMHSILLVVDKNYQFWRAMQLSRKMVNKRWWMTFLFLVVAGIIWMAGGFACMVGLLITTPLYFAMKVFLYDDNFRKLAPASS
jgi:hypothetical protein